ncbi:aminopeptidase [Pseudalkalibacillus decolorationis]|uniref:aminopeptidase n=1 Tax=Pseudalkalibacillus decolorationis TaxID=163879 RepID=UPI0035584E23
MNAMTNETKLSNLAKVTVEVGINLQPYQTLFINASIEALGFVRKISELAYRKGAGNVHVEWSDQELSKQRLTYASEEMLASYPNWSKGRAESFVEENAAFLNIQSTDPDAFKDIDPKRVAIQNKAAALALRKVSTARQSGKVKFCVVCIPNEAWAKKVYPHLNPKDAVEQLWEAVFQMTRVDTLEPVKEWDKHIAYLTSKVDELNEKRYRQLYFVAPGTDLTIDLPDDHLWVGGGTKTHDGVFFTPNLPTEEVFTAPLKTGVNGTVTSTKPLIYSGTVIENIQLTFKDGKIVSVNASKGLDTLKELIKTDEGARYLGEVALVPQDSPIAIRETIFYHTLFDENASCHLAIGAAYPLCVQDGNKMTGEQLGESGLNTSITHVDFMIGSNEMNIDGIQADGHREPLFRNGCWVK